MIGSRQTMRHSTATFAADRTEPFRVMTSRPSVVWMKRLRWLAGAERSGSRDVNRRLRSGTEPLTRRRDAGRNHIRTTKNASQILPIVLVSRRLPLDEGQSGTRPREDFVDLIIQNELPPIGYDGQNCMSAAFAINNDRDQKSGEGPPSLQKFTALFQDIILAVSPSRYAYEGGRVIEAFARA